MPLRAATPVGLWRLVRLLQRVRAELPLHLLLLATLGLLAACGDGGSGNATPVTTEDERRDAAEATPSGDILVMFVASCAEDSALPFVQVAIEATATDDAVIEHIRVFVDGIQKLEQKTEDVREFTGELSVPLTPGVHQIRVSAEGTGLQRVSQSQEVECLESAEPTE